MSNSVIRKTALALSLVGAMAIASSPVFAKNEGQARVRVIHASPDAPPVDVLVNGAPALTGIAFGEATAYAAVPAGEYDVKVVPARGSASQAVIDADLNLIYYKDYTVIAIDNLAEITPLVLEDSNGTVDPQRARVRFVHASPDAPAVDVAVAGGPILFGDVAFGEVGDYVTVPAGRVDLEVRVAGTKTVALSLDGVNLEGGRVYTVVAIGQLAGNPSLGALLTVDGGSPSRGRGNSSFGSRSGSSANPMLGHPRSR